MLIEFFGQLGSAKLLKFTRSSPEVTIDGVLELLGPNIKRLSNEYHLQPTANNGAVTVQTLRRRISLRSSLWASGRDTAQTTRLSVRKKRKKAANQSSGRCENPRCIISTGRSLVFFSPRNYRGTWSLGFFFRIRCSDDALG